MNGDETKALRDLSQEVGRLTGVVETENKTTREQISELFHRVNALDGKLWRLVVVAVLIGGSVIGLDRIVKLVLK